MGGATTFDTAVGRCAVAWREHLVGVALPAGADEVRWHRGAPYVRSSPPGAIADAIRRIRGLLDGEPDDLADIALDYSGLGPFAVDVYVAARAVPPGATTSYGEIARAIGEPGAARAVGRALGANPFPIVVPCHRVLAADGRPGGFSAPGGLVTKDRLLSIERRTAGAAPTLFD